MVDFRVTVYDGSYHDVDSNELSFKLAGSLAFKDAMTRARPTILALGALVRQLGVGVPRTAFGRSGEPRGAFRRVQRRLAECCTRSRS